MKVLQLCTKSPYPARDGGALAVKALAEGLIKLNHQITIVAAATPKHSNTNGFAELPENLKIFNIPVDTNIKIFKLLLNLVFSRKPYIITRFYSSAFKKELIKILQSESFDIIQLEGVHMGIYLPVIRIISPKPIILRAHNVEHLIWKELARSQISYFKRMYLKSLSSRLKRFEERIIKEVSGLMPITQTDANKFQVFSQPPDIQVVGFGLDPDEYVPKSEQQENSVFYLGALDWMPNQEGLVWFLDKVWSAVRHQVKDVSFHVAGRNAPEWLKNKIIASGAFFHGEIGDSSLFIRSYQVMVVPLFSGSGVRVKIIEGMALAKPIVSTSKGAAGLDIYDEQEILIADPASKFIECLTSLLSDFSYQTRIGEAARAYIIKEFNILAETKKAETFYYKCLSNK